jgi:hypothetical protein
MAVKITKIAEMRFMRRMVPASRLKVSTRIRGAA